MSDRRIDREIAIRCNKTNQVLGLFSPKPQHPAVSQSTKKHIIKSIFTVHYATNVRHGYLQKKPCVQIDNNRDEMPEKNRGSVDKRQTI